MNIGYSDCKTPVAWWRDTTGEPDRTGVVVFGGDRSFTYHKDRVLSWQTWG